MYVRSVKSGVCGFIQSNLTHVRGVKKCIGSSQYRVMFTRVKGVESSSIYTIRAVMLYICQRCQKKFKMVLHIFAHNFLNIQWIFNPQKVLES